MDVIVSRSRTPGTASTYHYRALVPLTEVAARRRPRCVVIQAQIAKYDPAAPSQKCWRVYSPDGVEVITDLRRQADGGAPIPEGADPAVIWRERTETLRAIASESRILGYHFA